MTKHRLLRRVVTQLFEKKRHGKDRNRCAYFCDLRCCDSSAVCINHLTHSVYEKLNAKLKNKRTFLMDRYRFLAYPIIIHTLGV